nr:carbohydrate-binding family 9-like protein [Cohnella thailandensis]
MTERYTLPYRPETEELSEEDWSRIPPLAIDRQQWLFPDHPPKTEVRAYYDNAFIRLRFRVFEESPTIRHLADHAPVYEDSCVEFFLQPLPGEDARYLNFELNAAGALLLEIGGEGEKRRKVDADRGEFAIRSAVGLSDPASGRTYWELALRIPFAFLRRWYPDFRPDPDVVMRGNFYKCGDRTPVPHYLSWNPVSSERPNFHLLDNFGELVLSSAGKEEGDLGSRDV